MTTAPEVRVLRALSGVARAHRDLDQLALDLEGHPGMVAEEIGAELCFQTRRIAYVARLCGIGHDDIESACR